MKSLLLAAALIGGLLNGSHDVTTLSEWGPYSKQYSGISHVDNLDAGLRVDFTVVPGFYRRSYQVPNVLFESGCYPWRVDASMRNITYRYELEWKDRVYVDATYHILDGQRVLLQMDCHNGTDVTQNLHLQPVMSLQTDEYGPVVNNFRPSLEKGRFSVTAKWDEVDKYYGMAWDFPLSDVREFANSSLDVFMRTKVHRHVDSYFKGDERGHYVAAFFRPVVIGPQSDTTLFCLLAEAPSRAGLDSLLSTLGEAEETVFPAPAREDYLPSAEQYSFGAQLLQATVLTNVSYPIMADGQKIRHFCPGKNWNSLYTWDSGFIAMALAGIDPVKGFECIRAYTTGPDSPAPFIHHGTPLPTQFFAYSEFANSGAGREVDEYMFPRLLKWYRYMVDPSSGMILPNGLMATWKLFYNSGGWDDYPPQKYLTSRPDLRAQVAPMVSTSYYIRAAKILQMMARRLGYKAEVKALQKDIDRFTDAVQKHGWDREAGYFSYVGPDGIFRYSDGSNFNEGMDGCTPLVAGICTGEQRDSLLERIFTPDRMWTDVGISTVDRSAPYYAVDGYWNGCVWMPHQYLFWKAMLDLDETELAGRIAFRALECWERECRETYECEEHFVIASGRAGGWHNFSGLSCPVINWFESYFRVGKISTGFDVAVDSFSFNPERTSCSANLAFCSGRSGSAAIVVCMNPSCEYSATFRGRSAEVESPYPGLLYVHLPVSSSSGGELCITSVIPVAG